MLGRTGEQISGIRLNFILWGFIEIWLQIIYFKPVNIDAHFECTSTCTSSVSPNKKSERKLLRNKLVDEERHVWLYVMSK